MTIMIKIRNINPLRASDTLTRVEDTKIPTLALLSITSEILRIVSGKLLSYDSRGSSQISNFDVL